MDGQLVFMASRLSLTEILSQSKSVEWPNAVEKIFIKYIFKHFVCFCGHVFKFHVELDAVTLFLKSAISEYNYMYTAVLTTDTKEKLPSSLGKVRNSCQRCFQFTVCMILTYIKIGPVFCDLPM